MKAADRTQVFNKKWDKRFMRLALEISSWSKDSHTQVGAITVGPNREIFTTGYNGFPYGVDDNIKQRQSPPIKYLYTEHAERNSIFQAARVGLSLKGCSIYIASAPRTLPPCADCARAIIQSGIKEVIYLKPSDLEGWEASCEVALQMLNEAEIYFRHIIL